MTFIAYMLMSISYNLSIIARPDDEVYVWLGGFLHLAIFIFAWLGGHFDWRNK